MLGRLFNKQHCVPANQFASSLGCTYRAQAFGLSGVDIAEAATTVDIPEGDNSNKGDGAKLLVTETLGHASHNLSFQEPFNGGVFPGDAAGTYLPNCGVVVPTTPPPFYLESALASLDKLIALNPTVLYFSHFGRADQAVNRLKAYKAQLQLWADVAEAGVKVNKTLEQIRDDIIAADPVMGQIEDYVKDHPIYKKTVLENCVRGFVEYVKTKQAKQKS